MAVETVNQMGGYIAGRTLGRSGHMPDAADQMSTRIRQLDALMCVITAGTGCNEGFSNCNVEIREATLELASDLAHEIHELNTQLLSQSVLSAARGPEALPAH